MKTQGNVLLSEFYLGHLVRELGGTNERVGRFVLRKKNMRQRYLSPSPSEYSVLALTKIGIHSKEAVYLEQASRYSHERQKPHKAQLGV